MAKTESTAVNELISLVQGGTRAGTPDPIEPSADLFAERPAPTRVQPPRMTNTIPPMRGAGEVAPLPRGRAPQSTSQHSLSEQAAPVRMKTASPARGTTIPPLPRASTPPPARTTRPSLPPPRPTGSMARPSTSSMPALRNTPRATLPPQSMPTASPFEAAPPASSFEVNTEETPLSGNPFAAEPQGYPVVKAPVIKPPTGPSPVTRPPSVDLTADVIRGDNWFDVSSKVSKLHEETWVGTPREKSRKRELARMLAVPAIVAASVGVAIGVYISYRGGNKPAPHTSATPPVATHVTMPAPAPQAKEVVLPVTSTTPDPNSESHNAATASAGADQPQPPTKAEDAAQQQQAAALAAANPDDPAAEPTLTRDAPASATAHPAIATTGAAVQEIQTSHGVIKLVDVRINSKPAGATVMLVDDGKTSFLGKTPIATSVDATKSYDVIFTLEGRDTETAHLDPAASAKLDVQLSRTHHSHHESTAAAPVAKAEKSEAKVVDLQSDTKAAKPEAKPEPKIAEKTKAKPEQLADDDDDPLAKAAKPAAAKPAAAKPEAKADKKASKPSFDEEAELASLGLAPTKKSNAKGEGTLMVSSKPPCEIYVDGKATGLTTPQKAMALPAGTHKITFVNSAESIKKTVSVSITADKSTKLIQDLMAK